jgi:hypothetical protein
VGSRIGRKGVDAIFTPPKKQMDDRFLVGIVGILVGIALWTAVSLDSIYPKLFGVSEISSYSSLVLFSFGVIFVISGAGISMTYYPFSPTRRGRLRTSSQSYPEPETGILSSTNLKYGLISFIQSIIAIALYSGLADEYYSNPSMQEWIHANFPPGQLLLGRESVVVVAALLGLSIVQFLPAKHSRNDDPIIPQTQLRISGQFVSAVLAEHRFCRVRGSARCADCRV